MSVYNARFYDAYFTGVDGESEFYVDEALDVDGPVLELGCGTGRILLPIARAGVEIVGVDISDELLQILHGKLAAEDPSLYKRVELVEADMGGMDLERRFAAAFIPYRTFQHLLDPLDQQRALRCIGEHLEDEGRLVFNTFDPLAELARDGFKTPLCLDVDFIDAQTGHRVSVYYSRHADPEVQILEQELIFEEFTQDGQSLGRQVSLLQLRWTPQGEMRYLLERCGFAVEALYGDFFGGPYPGFGEQVWVVRRG
ncbi:MAG: class I SAM-dependent methyltransferase [Candidatus Latescibacterota bacterium]|jgi:SAM-dependent methyltransferase